MIQPSRKKTFFFFFNDTATTEIYTLSLHDALPIFVSVNPPWMSSKYNPYGLPCFFTSSINFCRISDRKSTRLNSSHSQISYAVFCLKKKKNVYPETRFRSTLGLLDFTKTPMLHITT